MAGNTQIHFISGLPRSGSTLLAGILRQNPRFHAAMTGPVGRLVNVMINTMGSDSETSVFLDEEKKKQMLLSVFETYYNEQKDKDIVFDTNRLWCSKLSLVNQLFPGAKVLCCVRSVSWIMDSIENIVRKNAYEPSKLFGSADERATVYSRTEALAHRDRLVGFAWSSLKEAYYGNLSKSLLLIEYDILTQRPKDCMKLIYEFLEEPWFEHNFDSVEYDEPEFDKNLNTPGLHAVKRKVEFKARPTILPPDIFDKYKTLSFWRDPKGSAAFRITVDKKEK